MNAGPQAGPAGALQASLPRLVCRSFATSWPSRAVQQKQDSARELQWVSRTRGDLTCGHLPMFPEFGTTQLTLKMPAPERGSSERVTQSGVHFFGDGRKQMLVQNLRRAMYRIMK